MAWRDTEIARQQRARTKAGEGYLYVAEIVGTDIIKIGFSLNPENRIKVVGPLGPLRHQPMRLLGYFACSLLSEKKLHRLLRQHTSATHGNEFYPRAALIHAAQPDPRKAA